MLQAGEATISAMLGVSVGDGAAVPQLLRRVLETVGVTVKGLAAICN